jgi:hypothetical protein
VYKLSIGAACGLSWPFNRIVIQVLDDSTDPTVKVRFSLSAAIRPVCSSCTGGRQHFIHVERARVKMAMDVHYSRARG